jgi:hypothetical protein
MPTATRYGERTLDALFIDDEDSFKHVRLYEDLKQVLVESAYRFRILPAGTEGRWDRALLLNLTFWGAASGGDVLVDDQVSADVVAHVAWHQLAVRALPTLPGARPSSDSLFFGEAIASAFDVYLVGRLLGHAPKSSFLESQVSAMAGAWEAAGASMKEFETLLESMAKDPERAFEDLRELLFDATSAIHACTDADQALAILTGFDGHRFGALLHHYELSNWVLYARAYGDGATDRRVRALDSLLRGENGGLDYLVAAWIRSCP